MTVYEFRKYLPKHLRVHYVRSAMRRKKNNLNKEVRTLSEAIEKHCDLGARTDDSGNYISCESPDYVIYSREYINRFVVLYKHVTDYEDRYGSNYKRLPHMLKNFYIPPVKHRK